VADLFSLDNQKNILLAEIDSLVIDKQKLAEDIERLTGQRNKNHKTISAEISLLNRKKDKLLLEVKLLDETLFLLRGAKSQGEKSLSGYFTGRENLLLGFSDFISSKLDRYAKSLHKREQRLIKQEKNIFEMGSYSENLLEVAYNRFGEVAEVELYVQSELKEASEFKDKSRQEEAKVSDLLKLTELKLANASRIEKDALMLLGSSRIRSRKILAKAVHKAKDLKRFNDKLKAWEFTLKREEKRLSDWNIQLKDREAVFRRSVEEVKNWKRK